MLKYLLIIVFFVLLNKKMNAQSVPLKPVILLTPSPAVPQPNAKAKIANKTNVKLSKIDILTKQLTKFYLTTGSNFITLEQRKKDPTGTSSISEAQYALNIPFYIGFGPIKIDAFSFNTQYKYEQNWWTETSQIKKFNNEWWTNKKANSFIFTTSSMYRNHEINLNLKYSIQSNNLSISISFLSRLYWVISASSILGDSNEIAKTVKKGENFVPAIEFRYGKTFKSKFSMPFKVEINSENPLETYALYSWNSKGRGRVFSFMFFNEYYISPINTYINFDFDYFMCKFADITKDKNKYKFALSIDFPVIDKLRVDANISYIYAKDIWPRIRYPIGTPLDAITTPQEKQKIDRTTAYLSSIYYFLDSRMRHKIFFNISTNVTTSPIADFNLEQTIMNFGYVYNIPNNQYNNILNTTYSSEDLYVERF